MNASPPRSLSKEAAKVWVATVSEHDLGGPDRELLTAGLEQLDVYRKAMKEVETNGTVVVNPASGNPKANPALAVAHAALRAYRQVLSHLGLEESAPKRKSSRKPAPSPRRSVEASEGGRDPREVLKVS